VYLFFRYFFRPWGVLAGSLMSEYINEKYLNYVAGVGFIAIGVITLCNA